MIDHMTLHVSNYEQSKKQLLAALEPLGFALIMELTQKEYADLPAPFFCGMGPKGKAELWLRPAATKEVTPMHVAFRAQNRREVDAFYKAAMHADLRDNGAPGLREDYHPHYYAAFVLTKDGHNIEVVCHTPEA